jgi:hypothetical protein
MGMQTGRESAPFLWYVKRLNDGSINFVNRAYPFLKACR